MTAVLVPTSPIPTPTPTPTTSAWDIGAPLAAIALLGLLLMVLGSVLLAGLFGAFEKNAGTTTNPPTTTTIAAGGYRVTQDTAEFLLARCDKGYSRVIDLNNWSAICVPDRSIDRTGQNTLNPPSR